MTKQGELACPARDEKLALSRRAFLLGSGATFVWLTIPGCRGGPRVLAEMTEYPRRAIVRLAEVEVAKPVPFNYPWDHPSAANFLIKLGQPAGGGIGLDRDIVAFNSFCTHQGGPLAGLFRADLGVAGPCPLHWTTFDLTRHGMVVSGHATSALPQILLEIEGEEIVAKGVVSLIFGHHDHGADPTQRRQA